MSILGVWLSLLQETRMERKSDCKKAINPILLTISGQNLERMGAWLPKIAFWGGFGLKNGALGTKRELEKG